MNYAQPISLGYALGDRGDMDGSCEDSKLDQPQGMAMLKDASSLVIVDFNHKIKTLSLDILCLHCMNTLAGDATYVTGHTLFDCQLFSDSFK